MMLRPAKTTRTTLIATTALTLCGASVAPADALFSRWYVRHEPELMIGHDSNVYGASDNEISDGFTQALYRLTAGRIESSLTQLDLTGQVESTWFFSENDANSVDGGVQLDFAFPRDRQGSYWEARANWRSETEVERTLQDRIRREVYGLDVAGEWYPSPKLILSGGALVRETDRSSAGYATNRVTRFTLGLGHAWIPERRWFLEYSLELGESDPAGAVQSTDSRSHIVGLRVRGRILPKVTGSALVGYEHSTFTGRQDFSDSGLSGSADIRWESSPLLTVALSGRRNMEFSPSGAVTRRDTVTLSVDRMIGSAYAILLDVSPDRLDYDNAENRKDRILNLSLGLRYRQTERFYAQADVTWGTIDSNLPERDADQTILSLRSGMRF